MVLRDDDRQWLIYDPHTVDMVFKALEASALVMFGAWLQHKAGTMPSSMRDNIGVIGSALHHMGEARQQIQAGLAPNDIPDELVNAQRGLDVFMRWLNDPTAVPLERVSEVMDEVAGAMAYLNQRTLETGTNHPRWNSRIISGEPCGSCGR